MGGGRIVAGDDDDRHVGLRQREPQPHHDRAAHGAPEIEVALVVSRSGDVQTAGASIVYYEKWRQTRDDALLGIHRHHAEFGGIGQRHLELDAIVEGNQLFRQPRLVGIVDQRLPALLLLDLAGAREQRFEIAVFADQLRGGLRVRRTPKERSRKVDEERDLCGRRDAVRCVRDSPTERQARPRRRSRAGRPHRPPPPAA